MDAFAALVAHYFFVFLKSIGADSVISYIAKEYRNPNLIDYCLKSQQDFMSSCGEFTMLGYIIILFFVTMLLGRGFFFVSSSTN